MSDINRVFYGYMSRGELFWDCSFFERFWSTFPSSRCRCCEGHLFLHCGPRLTCHKGFEVHGKACSGCESDRIHSLLRYEDKMSAPSGRVIIASEFDRRGFVCYLSLTEGSDEIKVYGSYDDLLSELPDADVDVYQERGDTYDVHNV